ncbi:MULTISPECIES: NfeD family protein [Haloferax]|uniref:NfeD family protein n=2 Tax=Haloferax TaxID=2251 RepID=A0A6G1Z5E5_9EURY|nr:MULTISPECIES: NfeD family protein [Haloferax]KAB1189122.1 NfeD family protein [Haloferax sp. CBA1149]MRW81857.1 NfeD family protein [Haloferax marinisediminis]
MARPPFPLQLDLIGPETLPLVLVLAGLGLSLAEAMAPGAHFVVLGVALLAAGLVGLLIGPFATPLVLGLLVFVFGALALYGYRELDLYGGKGEGKTSDSKALKGKTGRVTERVTPTDGEVKLDEGGFNPYYAARSVHGELEVGSEIVVVDPGGGNVVTVEGFGPGEDEIDRELARERARKQRERDEREREAEDAERV